VRRLCKLAAPPNPHKQMLEIEEANPFGGLLTFISPPCANASTKDTASRDTQGIRLRLTIYHQSGSNLVVFLHYYEIMSTNKEQQ
jgi:hypothetical protein